jgi:hypothetical protein
VSEWLIEPVSKTEKPPRLLLNNAVFVSLQGLFCSLLFKVVHSFSPVHAKFYAKFLRARCA